MNAPEKGTSTVTPAEGREEKYFRFEFSDDIDSINVFDSYSAIVLAKKLIEGCQNFTLSNMCPRHTHNDNQPCTERCRAFIRGVQNEPISRN